MAGSSPRSDLHRLSYDAFPSDSDGHHLYVSLTPWTNPQGYFQALGPSSAMFRRPESSIQGQYVANNVQYSATLEFTNPHPIDTAWPTAAQGRSEVSPGDTLVSPSYGYADGSSSAQPRPSTLHSIEGLLQEQDASGPQRPYEGHSAAYHHAPPGERTLPSTASGSAPVAGILNEPSQPSGSLHVQTHILPPQTPLYSLPPASSLLGQVSPLGYPAHNDTATFPPSVTVVSNPVGPNVPLWNATGIGSSRITERFDGVDTGWPLVGARTQQDVHGHVSLELSTQTPVEYGQYPPPLSVAVTRPSRRTGTRSNLPRVAASFVARQKKNKTSVRRGPLDQETREKAHRMRGGGTRPCLRCRFYKCGCDDDGLDGCKRCAKTRLNARVFYLPCTRDQLEDTNLVRRCNGRFAQPEADFLGYPWKKDGKSHVMEIMWYYPGYGPVSTRPLTIYCRKYEPEGSPINTTESQWLNTSGQLVKVEQPPYAIFNTAAFQHDVEELYSQLPPSLEEWIFNRNRHDSLASLTFQEAFRLRTGSRPENELIALTLILLHLSVFSQGYGSVRATNIPDIKQYDYSALGHSGYEAYDRNSCDRPLPVAINHQMDVALVKLRKRLEEKCFKLLNKMIFQKTGVKPWYELFIAFFVIFWNLEYSRNGAQEYIKTKNGTHVAQQVRNVVHQQIQKFDFSFGVLMDHWKGVLRNHRPFVLARDNPDELRLKKLVPDELAFIYMMNMAEALNVEGPSRYPPPLIGFAHTMNSRSSQWIGALIKAAGG